jgi:hypothetical protein
VTELAEKRRRNTSATRCCNITTKKTAKREREREGKQRSLGSPFFFTGEMKNSKMM